MPKNENVMNTARVISTIAEKKLHAHNKTNFHTMKVYNNRPISLSIKFLVDARYSKSIYALFCPILLCEDYGVIHM